MSRPLAFLLLRRPRSYLAASAVLIPRPRNHTPFCPSHHNISYSSSSSPTHAHVDEPDCNDDDDDDDAVVMHRTLRWLESVVIGMNLCPFADRPHRERMISIDVCRDRSDHGVAAAVLAESTRRRSAEGTTLLVCPRCHPSDFGSYLDVVRIVEDGLQRRGLADDVQVAPFHPEFVFEGSSESSPDNWTNRSPYPTFHVLREDEVTLAVEKIDGDAGRVWKRNVNLLNDLHHRLGRHDFERFLMPSRSRSTAPEDSAMRRSGGHNHSDTGSSLPSDVLTDEKDLEDRVKEILRRFRSQL